MLRHAHRSWLAQWAVGFTLHSDWPSPQAPVVTLSLTTYNSPRASMGWALVKALATVKSSLVKLNLALKDTDHDLPERRPGVVG